VDRGRRRGRGDLPADGAILALVQEGEAKGNGYQISS